jgi:hypothetical protein
MAADLVTATGSKEQMPTSLAAMVEAALQNQSQSFVRDSEELQMLVCALAAANAVIGGASPSSITYSTNDLLAVSLWLGFSFQPPRSEPKLEALRSDVLETARTLVSNSATSGRRRALVPEFSVSLAEEELSRFDEDFKAGTEKTINALRTNAALDREELELLWWVLGDWSTSLGSAFSKAESVASALAAGIEGGGLLRRLPAEAHKHIVLRGVSESAKLTASELVAALGASREKLAAVHSKNARVATFPNVFVVLSLLATGHTKAPGAKLKRPLREWASRAFVESTILHLSTIIAPEAIY